MAKDTFKLNHGNDAHMHGEACTLEWRTRIFMTSAKGAGVDQSGAQRVICDNARPAVCVTAAAAVPP
eukprot:366453-Chlamydomonas_euryale.AAC.17